MKRSVHGLVLAAVLVIAGLGLFTWKVRELGYPVFPDETADVWAVQVRLPVRPGDGPLKVDLVLPTRTPGLALSDEHFVSRGFGVTVDEDPWQRSVTWSIRRAENRQSLYYRAVFFLDDRPVELAPVPRFPQPPTLEEPFDTALQEILDEVREESADVASFAAQVLARLDDPTPDANVALFQQGPLGMDRAHVAQLILSGARIPALVVHGVRLVDTTLQAPLETLLAVHNGDRWLWFDPETGDPGLPPDFLAWWTGDDPLARVMGGRMEEPEISIRRQTVSSLDLATERADRRGTGLQEFSLLALPMQSQSVYEILLLLPLGALVIVVLRNVVGVRSFGTFMPVLIALAFRETRLVAGFVLFTGIVAVGLAFRFYLERLRLLLVPRLAAVLTIVILLMAVTSVISHRLGVEAGLSVALFPMVIIAMVIERMSIVWEEQGPGTAITDGVGSLLVAAIAYLVMGIELFGWWVLVFPELLLVVLGFTLALGRYTGYRASELLRFRELAP